MLETTRRGEKLNVFISYSRDDLEFADQLEATLSIGGFAPMVDRHGIAGGEAWQSRLGNLIRDADTVVFVLTPSSARSDVCAWEVTEAVRLGKRILPVVPRPLGGSHAPQQLAALNYIFFYSEPKKPGSGFGSGLTGLVAALNTDHEWLREHTRLLQRASEWDSGGRPANRLLSGSDIADGKAWVARRPNDAPALTELHLDFIKASETVAAELQNERQRQLEERERLVREAETAQEREAAAQAARERAQQDALAQAKLAKERAELVARRTKAFLAGALVALLLVAGVGTYAWTQRGRAEAASQEAQRRATETVKLRAETQFTESGLLANAAGQLVDVALSRDAGSAMLLALEALPDETAGIKRPYVAEAQVQLDRALRVTRERDVLTGHTSAVHSAAFSADGTRIVTASYDKTARVWDAATGKETARLEGHTGRVTSAAFSADGTRIVTASYDKTARVWDAATGKDTARLEGHTGTVTSAAFSADGTRIVTASYDNTARVWDAAPGKETARLEGHTSLVFSAAFSADGTRIVTASDDKTARVWRAFPIVQKLVDAAKSRMRRCLTPEQRKAYFLPVVPPVWCLERRLWPYHADDWQAWYEARKAGKDLPTPGAE